MTTASELNLTAESLWERFAVVAEAEGAGDHEGTGGGADLPLCPAARAGADLLVCADFSRGQRGSRTRR